MATPLTMTPAPGSVAFHPLVRSAVVLAVLAVLALASWQIVQPFAIAGLWAVVIVVTTWPGLLWLQSRLGGRRWLAVSVLTLLLLLLVVTPLTLAITAAVMNAGEIVDTAKSLSAQSLPALPAWLTSLPFVGAKILLLWEQITAAGIEGVLTRLAPYAGTATKRLLAEASGFGFVLMEFLLALAFSVLLWVQGEEAAALVDHTSRKLAGRRGHDAVVLGTQAIRGVALGVGGTAVVQSVLAGLGLSVAGVPYAALLTAITFAMCIVQLGTPVVMIPAVAWLYWTGDNAWATGLLVWSVLIGMADNVVRPLLIKRGVDLPFWLVFTGVVGGLLAFGLVGMFIGPVVLAVASMLLDRWLHDGEVPAPLAEPAVVAEPAPEQAPPDRL